MLNTLTHSRTFPYSIPNDLGVGSTFAGLPTLLVVSCGSKTVPCRVFLHTVHRKRPCRFVIDSVLRDASYWTTVAGGFAYYAFYSTLLVVVLYEFKDLWDVSDRCKDAVYF